jgi:O-antigen/teichoic acid export membrane protein
VAARALGPRAYGAFAGLMAILMILGVLQLGLQATAARRISADPDQVGQIERGILAVTYRAALLVGGLTVLLSPLVMVLLRLEDLAPALLLAATVVPMTVMGGQAGILQGERRWGPLAVVYVAAGLPRILLGTLLVLIEPTETAAMAGVALAAWAPVLVGWWVLRAPRPARPPSEEHFARRIAGESVRNSQALLAFFAVSNIDVVVARNVLDDHASGLYAAGLILTKALLFLPQFVVVLAFPDMAAHRRGPALAAGVATISGLGALGVLGCWLLPDVALAFVGGAAFGDVRDQLWSFALLGTVLAVLQLLVYSVLARDGRASSAWVWLALVAMLAVGSTADSAGELVNRVVAVDAALLVVLLVATRLGTWRGGR